MVNKYLNLADTNYTEKLKPEIKLVNIKNITKKFNLPKYYVICPDADYGPSKRCLKMEDLVQSLQGVHCCCCWIRRKYWKEI